MGNEIQKLKEQTVPETSVQVQAQPVFEHTYRPLEQEALLQYSQQKVDQYAAFSQAFAERMRMADLEETTVQSAPVHRAPVQHAPVEQPPVQPELSEKDQKKLRKQAEKKREAGRKLTPHATEYTIDLMAAMKDQVALRDQGQDQLREKLQQIPADRQRVFGGLTYFMPPLQMGKKHQATPESLAGRNAFLDRCVQQPQRVLHEIKREMFSKTWVPEHFTATYVAEHFAEVRQELDRAKGFLAIYREGTPEFESLTPLEKARVGMIQDLSDRGQAAFRSALAAHGLEFTEYGLNPMEEMQGDNDADVAALRAVADSLQERKRQFLEEESERVLAIKEVEREHIFDDIREDMRQDPEMAFITSERFSNLYQYETIRDAKQLLERYPAKYAEHKELLDRIYQEMLTLMDGVAVYSSRAQSINDATYDGNLVKDEAVKVTLAAKMDIYKAKYEKLLGRISHLMAGIKYLTKGSQMGYSDALILAELGYTAPEHAADLRTRKQQAEQYAVTHQQLHGKLEETVKARFPDNPEMQERFLTDTNGRSMMLMKLDDQAHNERVLDYLILADRVQTQKGDADPELKRQQAVAAKELVIPYLRQIMEFDAYSADRADDEELMASQEGFMQVGLSGMMIADLAALKDPDQPELSIKDAYLGDKKPMFALRGSVSQAYIDKSRALSMIEAYKKGVLTEDTLNETEKWKLGWRPDQPLSAEVILDYAKQKYRMAAGQFAASRNRYAQDSEIITKVTTHATQMIPTSHPGFDEKQRQIRDRIRAHTGDVKADTCKIYAAYCKEQLAALKKQYDETTDDQKLIEIRGQMSDLQDQLEWTEILYSLMYTHYRLCGEQKERMNEMAFRSFSSVEQVPAFREMTEDAFVSMCKKMAAGQLSAETEEEIQAAKEANLEGLKMFKERVRIHYTGLEERYHHKLPPLEYVQENLDQIEMDFANTQMDTNLLTHVPELFDQNNADDRLLLHLVKFYNAFGGSILTYRHMMIAMGNYDDVSLKKQAEDYIKEKEGPSQMYVRSVYR